MAHRVFVLVLRPISQNNGSEIARNYGNIASVEAFRLQFFCGRGVIHVFGNNRLRNAIFAVRVSPIGKQISCTDAEQILNSIVKCCNTLAYF